MEWETTEQTFHRGSDLSVEQLQELLHSYNDTHGRSCGAITEEALKVWPDSDCLFQDLSLYTHTHGQTQIRIWNYGLGDNDYGTLHFQRKGQSVLFAENSDSELVFHNVHVPGEMFQSILNWYKAIEEDPERAEEVLGGDFKTVAPRNW